MILTMVNENPFCVNTNKSLQKLTTCSNCYSQYYILCLIPLSAGLVVTLLLFKCASWPVILDI